MGCWVLGASAGGGGDSASAFWEDGKFWRWVVVMAVQQCECTEHPRPVHLKVVKMVGTSLVVQ